MVFSKFAKKQNAALFLGAPEAEAESLPTSKVSLFDVYEDHHDLFGELSNEKIYRCRSKRVWEKCIC